MRPARAASLAASILVIAGCADSGLGGSSQQSGIVGVVVLGPTCPVVVAGQECGDKRAVSATVTISEQAPDEAYAAGQVVATTTTDARGAFRVSIPPGSYVVTAQAGMSCEPLDAHVTADEYSVVEVPCDTGIR